MQNNSTYSGRYFQKEVLPLKMKKHLGLAIAGGLAGAVTGLFGAGGGMVLVPLLVLLTDISDDAIFPSSVAIILPIGLTALFFGSTCIPLSESLPYLIGSSLGGIGAGLWGKKIPTVWLHRFLGAMILWGGFRYLC